MKKKFTIIIILLMTTVMISGCTQKDIPKETSKETTTGTNNSITVNKIDFKVLKNEDINSEMKKTIEFIKQSRGYTIMSEDENSYYIFISSGERNTGGYDIEVLNVDDNEGKTIITIQETVPGKDQMVTEALTYPNVVIVIPKNISPVFLVFNTDGEEFKDISDAPGEGNNHEKTYGIIGEITALSINKDNISIMVEGEINKDSEYDKASVRIDEESTVFLNDELTTADSLEEGMEVRVIFEGPVMESYPIQAYAKIVYAFSTTVDANDIIEQELQVTIAKMEDYEGKIILTTENGLRMKVDNNTKLSIGQSELEVDLSVWVVLSNDKNKADPTDYYAVSVSSLNISDYFPMLPDMHMKYKGSGNEYAPYETYVDFLNENMIQIRNINGGTTTVNVYEIKKDSLVRTFSQGETYYKYNYMDLSNNNEIIIMNPLKVGTAWNLNDGTTRRITGINIDITTPSGSYKTLEITSKYSDSTVKNYYAKNIGLVKTEFTTSDEDTLITSELEIVEETPFSQVIRIYYPDFMNDGFVYINRVITINSNKEISKQFENEFKIIPENSGLTKVLSPDVNVLGIKLDDEMGTVTINFSNQLIPGMNAGSSLESMIIKSIANTIGYYYQRDKVIITIEGLPYESGHFLMIEGEHFDTDFEGIEVFETN
jgi:hypothetical protein